MKVFYKKDKHVTLYFGRHELKQALGVLQALAQYFKLKFLYDAVDNLKRDLFPPKIAYELHTRLCPACKMEVDLDGDNKHETESGIFHKVCPALKQPLTIRDL